MPRVMLLVKIKILRFCKRYSAIKEDIVDGCICEIVGEYVQSSTGSRNEKGKFDELSVREVVSKHFCPF